MDEIERAGPPRLQVRGICVRFGGLDALTGVDLEVHDREVVALIGPNGAGKTTLFNTVCGLVTPTSGTIEVSGRPAPRRPERLAGLGVARTLQGLGMLTGLTVRENVLVAVLTHPEAGERAEEALHAVGLLAVADRPVTDLPYPEQKRVALARALAIRPRLLLLDEPAGGLGRDDIEDLAGHVRTAADAGCAVLLVEHDVEFVMSVSDRVVVLDFGRVIATGTPREVRDDPAVLAAYLGLEVSR